MHLLKYRVMLKIHFYGDIMKKIIVLLLVVILITSCVQPHVIQQHMPEAVPIDGLESEIIAQGYIMVYDSRYSPNPPFIIFHPYPGYFHLFYFAAWNGVPHVRVTNSVDALFELLGVNRLDVPFDRFGNKQINNVAAVFNNFTQYKFFDIPSVNAEITGFIDDWQGDEWEITHPNFIMFTNGDRSIEPTQVWIGDNFLGLELTRIESSWSFLKNGETYYQFTAEAVMSGRIVLGGYIRIGLYFDSTYRVRAGFAVANDYLPYLPRIADFGYMNNLLHIGNTDVVMSAFGVTRRELDAARSIEFAGVTALLEVSWISSFGYYVYFIDYIIP